MVSKMAGRVDNRRKEKVEYIVHIIDNLGRGGAETLFVDLLPALSRHYRVVLVTLDDRNEFGDDVFHHCYKHYNLNHTSNATLFSSVAKLKRIIKAYQPVLVRSQLFWSTVIAKIACPKKIPLVFSVHTLMSDSLSKGWKGSLLKRIEKLTTSGRHILVGVTKQVVNDYVTNFKYNGKSYVLYNYVRESFFSNQRALNNFSGKRLKLVAVGNLSYPKNYNYLIEAFKKLRTKNISLDIYGDGPLNKELSNEIDRFKLPISLKGKSANIFSILQHYDCFVLVSSFEGFGIAVAEAMAVGLPLILSGLPVLREVTDDRAFFIDLSNPDTFVNLVQSFLSNENDINIHVQENISAAKEKYTQKVYLQGLLHIYKEAIKSTQNKPSEISLQ